MNSSLASSGQQPAVAEGEPGEQVERDGREPDPAGEPAEQAEGEDDRADSISRMPDSIGGSFSVRVGQDSAHPVSLLRDDLLQASIALRGADDDERVTAVERHIRPG